MKSKDRSDIRNKEGCGRVWVGIRNNVTHSYTLECGYHSAN